MHFVEMQIKKMQKDSKRIKKLIMKVNGFSMAK